MYLLIGLAIVAASVFTGYTLAHGEWGVLFQPAEFIIILGCGLGAFFGSQTKYTFSLIVKSLKHLFADPGSSKSRYLETLALLYALFSKMHREGVISIESDVEKPEASPIFSKYPNVSKDTRIVNFIGDTLRVYLTTGDPADIDSSWTWTSHHARGRHPAGPCREPHGRIHAGHGHRGLRAGRGAGHGQDQRAPEVLGHYIGAAWWARFSAFSVVTACSAPWAPSWKTLSPRNIFIIIPSRRPWPPPFAGPPP